MTHSVNSIHETLLGTTLKKSMNFDRDKTSSQSLKYNSLEIKKLENNDSESRKVIFQNFKAPLTPIE